MIERISITLHLVGIGVHEVRITYSQPCLAMLRLSHHPRLWKEYDCLTFWRGRERLNELSGLRDGDTITVRNAPNTHRYIWC